MATSPKRSLIIFNCVRTERLLELALAGDEEAKRKLKLLKLPHALCLPYRDSAIRQLAMLITQQAPGLKHQTLNKIIEAALDGRYADPCFHRFSAADLKEIMAGTAEVTFWLDGAKGTIKHREIGRVIQRGP